MISIYLPDGYVSAGYVAGPRLWEKDSTAVASLALAGAVTDVVEVSGAVTSSLTLQSTVNPED